MSGKSKPFAGRDDIVTGATCGIGMGVAPEPAGRGADVAFNYEKNAEAARPPRKNFTARVNYWLTILDGVERLILRTAIILLLIIALVKVIMHEIG